MKKYRVTLGLEAIVEADDMTSAQQKVFQMRKDGQPLQKIIQVESVDDGGNERLFRKV